MELLLLELQNNTFFNALINIKNWCQYSKKSLINTSLERKLLLSIYFTKLINYNSGHGDF